MFLWNVTSRFTRFDWRIIQASPLPLLQLLRMLDQVLINKVIWMRIEYGDSSKIPLARDVQFVTGFADLNYTFNLLRRGKRSSFQIPGVAPRIQPTNNPFIDQLRIHSSIQIGFKKVI